MTVTQQQALPGDILRDSDGTYWLRGDEFWQWSTFGGPVGYYGPWDPATMGPQGECGLMVRDGKPVP